MPQHGEDRTIVKERPDQEKNGKHIQAEAQSDNEPFGGSAQSLPDLRKASGDLKEKIAEARRHLDMPLDSALGSPDWEARAADGSLDLRDKEDDA
jgi:hypothetical protein